jgi:hypothetical protein
MGFEVLAAVIMKSAVFWGIMSCSQLKSNPSFVGKCRLHLQGRIMGEARNQNGAGSDLCWFVAWLIL